MFDKAQPSRPLSGRAARSVDFFRIELAPLVDGKISVSMTATTVDEEEPQLLDQEVASERIGTIDELLALIQSRVRVSSSPRASAALLLC